MIANWIPAEVDWRRFAACRKVDNDVFFPQSDLFNNRAKLICSTCPVTERCLAWAIATKQRYGIWGGKTSKERRQTSRDKPSSLRAS
jgi:WhiB family redox-sensing transcriptional regulator